VCQYIPIVGSKSKGGAMTVKRDRVRCGNRMRVREGFSTIPFLTIFIPSLQQFLATSHLKFIFLFY